MTNVIFAASYGLFGVFYPMVKWELLLCNVNVWIPFLIDDFVILVIQFCLPYSSFVLILDHLFWSDKATDWGGLDRC